MLLGREMTANCHEMESLSTSHLAHTLFIVQWRCRLRMSWDYLFIEAVWGFGEVWKDWDSIHEMFQKTDSEQPRNDLLGIRSSSRPLIHFTMWKLEDTRNYTPSLYEKGSRIPWGVKEITAGEEEHDSMYLALGSVVWGSHTSSNPVITSHGCTTQSPMETKKYIVPSMFQPINPLGNRIP